jgi:hypothetical protein
MKIKIEVTQDDINKGERGNARFCPIARACSRIIPNSSKPSIAGGRWNYVNVNNIERRFNVPDFVNDFINDYDLNNPVTPIEFDIDIPENNP